MSLSLPFLWTDWLLLAGPLLALLYAISATCFVSGWFEVHNMEPHISAVLKRLVLIGPVLAIVLLDNKNDKNDGWIYYSYWTALMIVVWSLSVYLIQATRREEIEGGPRPPTTLVDWKDKVVIITGANTGIGYETALAMAGQGAITILACRSMNKAVAAKTMILQKHPRAQIQLVQLDLSSLESVRAAAQQILKDHSVIHCLINNAGVMMKDLQYTASENEMVLQCNHLGHYLWTRLLLPAVERATDTATITTTATPFVPRIIVVTSSTYRLCPKIPLTAQALNCRQDGQPNPSAYTLFRQYAVSKLANILFAKQLVVEIAKKSKNSNNNIFVAAVHPGLVRTDVVRNMPWYLKYPNIMFAYVIAALQKTPAQGAWCTLYVANMNVNVKPNANGDTTTTENVDTAADTRLPALSSSSSSSSSLLPSVNDSNNNDINSINGQYWVNRKIQPTLAQASDMEDAQALWDLSATMVGLSTSNTF